MKGGGMKSICICCKMRNFIELLKMSWWTTRRLFGYWYKDRVWPLPMVFPAKDVNDIDLKRYLRPRGMTRKDRNGRRLSKGEPDTNARSVVSPAEY